MAEVSSQTPSLSEQYLLPNEEKVSKPLEVTKLENGGSVASEEVAAQVESPTSAEESTEAPAAAATESGEAPADAAENSNEETVAAAEESTDTEQEVSGDQEESEETPEIKLETAPADFRFPTTNQTRHCFTRYIEYHRCIAAKGEGAPECDKFAKYYRSLCPGEWIDRWNEQRENGTFPGPL